MNCAPVYYDCDSRCCMLCVSMPFKNIQTSQQVSPHHHNMRWMKKLLMHEGGAEHEAT